MFYHHSNLIYRLLPRNHRRRNWNFSKRIIERLTSGSLEYQEIWSACFIVLCAMGHLEEPALSRCSYHRHSSVLWLYFSLLGVIIGLSHPLCLDLNSERRHRSCSLVNSFLG